MEICQGQNIVFRCTPSVFRRVHVLCPNTLELKYSHTDLVVAVENGSDAMIEIVQGSLRSGNYKIKMSGHTFNLHFSQQDAECINWIKKLVFACYPYLPVCDMYGNNVLRPSIR